MCRLPHWQSRSKNTSGNVLINVNCLSLVVKKYKKSEAKDRYSYNDLMANRCLLIGMLGVGFLPLVASQNIKASLMLGLPASPPATRDHELDRIPFTWLAIRRGRQRSQHQDALVLP